MNYVIATAGKTDEVLLHAMPRDAMEAVCGAVVESKWTHEFTPGALMGRLYCLECERLIAERDTPAD